MKTNKTLKSELRKKIYFSEEFKRQKVKDIEQNLYTVSYVSKEYSVTKVTVYRWIYKYSNHLKKGVIQVIQMESEQEKTKKLQAKIAELERIVGQKQMQIDFLEKMIDIGKEEFGIDLKKKPLTPPLTGLEPTNQNIITK